MVILLALLTSATTHAQMTVPPGLEPGDSYHLVFATSGLKGIDSNTALPPTNSNFFGGLDQADWVVTFHAFQAGLPQSDTWDFINPIYRAILSDSGSSASDRLNIGGPIYKTNGQLVATGETDLFDGGIASPIDRDELGNALVGNNQAWTGTSVFGSITSIDCSDWTSNSSASIGIAGTTNLTAGAWVSASTVACDQTAHLYGLSPLLTVPLTADFDGDGDVDGADLLQWQRDDGTAQELTNWQNEYGASLNEGALQAVPEPGSLVLIGFAVMGLFTTESRRRS